MNPFRQPRARIRAGTDVPGGQTAAPRHQRADERFAWALRRCREAGLCLTSARERILRHLAAQRLPLSWDMLAHSVELRGHCDPATISRTLRLFQEVELVRQFSLPSKVRYFLLNAPGADSGFLICRCCGVVREFPLSGSLLHSMEQLAGARGFSWKGHELACYGLCDVCAEVRSHEQPPTKLSAVRPLKRARGGE